jgi:uncharacterized protein
MKKNLFMLGICFFAIHFHAAAAGEGAEQPQGVRQWMQQKGAEAAQSAASMYRAKMGYNKELLQAIENDDEEKVRELLALRGIDPNTQDADGNTALMLAITKPGIAALLIRAGADVNTANNKGHTALIWAIAQDNDAIVKELIAAGANLNAAVNTGLTALMIAAWQGNNAIVKELIAAGANLNAVDNEGHTALMMAAWRGNNAIVKELIAAGANVNAVGNTGHTALMFAIEKGNNAIVKELIAAGANLNAADNEERTTLMLAVEVGNNAIVRELLTAGADVNVTTDLGATALMYASFKGNREIARELLAAGANVNAAAIEGDTALMLAAKMGRETMVVDLVATEADVNIQNKRGQTALMLAAERGHSGIVKLLLAAGADTSLQNNDNKTAYEIASENNHLNIARQITREVEYRRPARAFQFAVEQQPATSSSQEKTIHDLPPELIQAITTMAKKPIGRPGAAPVTAVSFPKRKKQTAEPKVLYYRVPTKKIMEPAKKAETPHERRDTLALKAEQRAIEEQFARDASALKQLLQAPRYDEEAAYVLYKKLSGINKPEITGGSKEAQERAEELKRRAFAERYGRVYKKRQQKPVKTLQSISPSSARLQQGPLVTPYSALEIKPKVTKESEWLLLEEID